MGEAYLPRRRLGRDIAPSSYPSFSFRLANADKIPNKHEKPVK